MGTVRDWSQVGQDGTRRAERDSFVAINRNMPASTLSPLVGSHKAEIEPG